MTKREKETVLLEQYPPTQELAEWARSLDEDRPLNKEERDRLDVALYYCDKKKPGFENLY